MWLVLRWFLEHLLASQAICFVIRWGQFISSATSFNFDLFLNLYVHGYCTRHRIRTSAWLHKVWGSITSVPQRSLLNIQFNASFCIMCWNFHYLFFSAMINNGMVGSAILFCLIDQISVNVRFMDILWTSNYSSQNISKHRCLFLS